MMSLPITTNYNPQERIVTASIESTEFSEIEFHLDNLFNELIEFCRDNKLSPYCNHSKSSIREGLIILEIFGHLSDCREKPAHKELSRETIDDAINMFEHQLEEGPVLAGSE